MLSLLAAALALAPHPPHCDSPRVDPLIRRAAWLQTTLPARHPLRRTLPPAEPAGDLPVSIRFVRPLRSAERAALADSYGLRFASAESRVSHLGAIYVARVPPAALCPLGAHPSSPGSRPRGSPGAPRRSSTGQDLTCHDPTL